MHIIITLFHIIQGLSLWLDYAFHLCLMLGSKVSLACETDIEMLTSYFQFSVKVLKSESQVSLLTLLRSA